MFPHEWFRVQSGGRIRVYAGMAALVVCLLISCSAFAQVAPTGTLTGSVLDPQGAAVVGAKIHIVDDATGTAYDTVSGPDGHFTVASMKSGLYTVTVTTEGFKKAIYKQVQIILGQTYDLTAKLEVGPVSVTVEVVSGQEVLETTTATVSNTITGKSITELPFTSRDTLDLALLLPGVQSPGRPRASTVEGLPKSAINITYDGINAQDNVLKSSDGFFTTIRPRIDAVEEFSITTAANGADQAGEGAAQIRFVTKRGGNEFHGGVWEYVRNDWFNANYYFNNLAGTSRQVMRLNEYGYKVGGPILKDKLFFFTDFDFFSLPQSLSRTRTLLTSAANSGHFLYNPVNQSTGKDCTPGSSGCVGTAPNAWTTCSASTGLCDANLMALGVTLGGPGTVDSQIGPLLSAMQTAVSAPGVRSLGQISNFQQQITFNNTGSDKRKFPDVRFDWIVSKNHSLEFDYHFSHFAGTPDFLNGQDITFPAAPFNTNQGSQISNRNLIVGAWRWTIGSNKSNELRFGIQSAPLVFFPDQNVSIYPQISTNLGAIRVTPDLTAGAGLMDSPFLGFGKSGRNTALGQLLDNFVWSTGRHTWSFGMSWTEIFFNDDNNFPQVSSVGLGADSNDPVTSAFVNGAAGNLPYMSDSDLGTAQSLYGLLAGRVTSYSGSVYLDPKTRQFRTGQDNIDKVRQREMGFYAQDAFKLRPSVTLSYGLRWEYQGTPWDTLNEYFTLKGGYAGLFGVSGLNNFFKPGTLTGSVPVYQLNGSAPWHNKYFKAFAPNAGIAWNLPSYDNRLLSKMFGGAGKSVLRAGYSIAYTREDLNQFLTIAPFNPGYFGSQFATAQACGSPVENLGASFSCVPGEFQSGSIAFQNLSIQSVAQDPASFVTSFTLDPSTGQGVNMFPPILKPPMVQSWSVGVQRELTSNMALEFRYVGNHGTGLFRQDNLNEVNIFENGFLQEFKNAQINLSKNGGASFANLNQAGGTLPVPILTAAFTGSLTGSQSNSSFSNGTFISELNSGQVGSMASILSGNLTFWENLTAAGLPKNFWVVNPDARGGSFRMTNGAGSTYNAFVAEFRRRSSKGLTFNGNYVFSKSLTDFYTNDSVRFNPFYTLRNPALDKGPAPYDLRHAFKLQLIYDLPFGAGRKWSSSNSVANRLLGGWSINTITRWQTGRVTLLTGGLGGTFNQYDGGVILNGITIQQFQGQLGVYKTPTPAPGAVWYVPAAFLDSSKQRANSSVLAACNTPGSFCGHPFIYGPNFFRADWTLAKTTKITERVSFEIRAEGLDLFNNANFLYAASASAEGTTKAVRSTSFGRITSAYQDISTTNDPGGRIIQLVGRINF